jgi:phosphoglycerate dehydrogenase-like enzyme
MNRIVVDLNDRRPLWAIPDWAVEELRAALPAGWALTRTRALADGSGDGRRSPVPEVLEAVRGARVYIGYGIPPEVLEAGKGTLEWTHTGTAGVGSSLHDAMRSSDVLFTNSAGIHGPPMAETVVGMLLYFFRGFDLAVAAQQEGRWHPEAFWGEGSQLGELSAATVGILGYGGIGREVGRRLRALGSRVMGLKRRPPAGGGGAPGSDGSHVDEDGVRLLFGEDGLEELLRSSQALVVTVPDTPATRGLLTRERIRTLPPGAVLVNVARGKVLDQEALVEALGDGHLRGAGLDVFRQEPLPETSPLWTLPNVLITPHVSGVTRGFWRRELDLILENLQRYLEGRALRNEVDLEAGY